MADSDPIRLVDPNGVVETISVEDGRVWHKRDQDVRGLLKVLAHERDNAPSKYGKAAWRKIGSIPLVVAEKWAAECGALPGTPEFLEYAKKKLMDGEFAALRVRGI